MPADSHEHPSFFRPDPDDQGHGGADSHDSIVEDFNAFFEKLSSLDDLQWSSGDDSGGEDGPDTGMAKAVGSDTTPPKRQPARPAPQQPKGADSENIAKRAASRYAAVKQPRKRPKVEVVSSDGLAAAAAKAPANPAVRGAAIQGSRNREEQFDAAKAARILKLALISLILFGLGLGAGWAALSFPSRFDNSMPSVKNGTAVTAPAVKASDSAQSAASGTVAKLGEWIWGHNADGRQTARAPRESADTAPRNGDRIAVSGAAGTAMENAAEESEEEDASRNPLTEIQPIEVPTVASDTSTESAKDSTQSEAGNGETGAAAVTEPPQVGDYALQVGACSAYRCVEGFRKLLLGQVYSGSIKVLTQPGAGGEGVIQRIRIEPLTRVEAERLKSALAAENPQFQGAYLVKTR